MGTKKLKYVQSSELTIVRKTHRKTFKYFFQNGRPVTDKATLARITAMVLPPAWQEVRICATANGHLQAVGKDAKGRMQYRYHEEWTKQRNLSKFHRMLEFAKALPAIRKRVRADLALPGLPREKILAAAVDILQKTNIRVGNEIYTRTNHSYGLTTLTNKHAQIRGSSIHFHFRAKSGKMRQITFSDPVLGRILKRCQDLPGQKLFEYQDSDGKVHQIKSCDINRYIAEISGNHFTAKDFRTWCATTYALEQTLGLGEANIQHPRHWRKRHLTIIRSTAEYLGNTPSICEKYYIHPVIFAADRAYRGVSLIKASVRHPGLNSTERFVVSLLSNKATRLISMAQSA